MKAVKSRYVDRRALWLAVIAITVSLGWAASPTYAAGPTLTTDSALYLPGTTVTYTGTGWVDCGGDIRIGLAPGNRFIDVLAPDASGSFSGRFIAPLQVGTYVLTGSGETCSDITSFQVVSALPTTTTTTSTTTTTTIPVTTTPTTTASTATTTPATTTPPTTEPETGSGEPEAPTAPVSATPLHVTG